MTSTPVIRPFQVAKQLSKGTGVTPAEVDDQRSLVLEEILPGNLFAWTSEATVARSDAADEPHWRHEGWAIESRTPSIREYRGAGRRAARRQPEPLQGNVGNKELQDRLQLLARKYAASDKFSDEEAARLAIVTERIRRILPAASVSDFEKVEMAIEKTRELKRKSDDVRSRLAKLIKGGI